MAITKINHPDLLELDSSTGATVLPKGTTAERPVSPEAGYIRFNTTDNVMETYDGTEWLTLDTISAEYSVNYLVVAGGGSGGGATYNGGVGGGGAGGLIESSVLALVNDSYTISVGAGGVNSNGGDSSFGQITAIGGGRSGYNSAVGLAGGSGGGGGNNGCGGVTAPGSGTSGQGNSGGTAYSSCNQDWVGGGGGGAGAVGTNGTSSGHGGIGLQSSITGSSTYYSGGGGAGGGYNIPPGNGGLGGGGNGSGTLRTAATAGSPNTGGGGGGINTGTNGGSGVVILRMPTANYSGTTTGSPTVTTDGSDTILTYTTSGTYTA